MVETRRKKMLAMGPDSESSGFQSTKSNASEDDYMQGGSSRKRKRAQSPSKTRLNTKKTASRSQKASDDARAKGSSSKKSNGKRRKNLERLPDMPFDILYEILSYLTPRDLANVHLTKMFNQALDHPDAKAVWNESRKQFNTPEPPPGFSEAYWARLLFVPRCQECNTNNVHHAEWKILKRLCSACKYSRLVGPKNKAFKDSMSQYPKEVFDLIPFTDKKPNTSHSADASKFYFDKDVHAVARKWATLSAGAGNPSGLTAFDSWKARRRVFVAACTDLAKRCGEWEHAYQQEKSDEWENRRQGIFDRFVDMGYRMDDIKEAYWESHQYFKSSAKLTDRAFNILKPKFEPVVKATRERREGKEHERLVRSRMKILDDLYSRFLTTLRPSERYACPHPSFLYYNPDIWDLLNKASNITVSPHDFQTAVGKFPELITDFQIQRSKKLVKDHNLNLAKNVLHCAQGYRKPTDPLHHTILGRMAIDNHPCLPQPTTIPGFPQMYVQALQCEIELNEAASSLATTLISLAGLDPTMATLSDMDTRDARFIIAFGDIPHFWTENYMIFTWRGALSYLVEQSHRRWKGTPTFKLATPDDTEKARRHSVELLATQKAWSCNHCQAFYDDEDAQMTVDVLEHLAERHSILDPKDGEDYLLNPHLWPLLEAPCEAPLQFTRDHHFKCKYPSCHPPKNSGINTWFNLDGIWDHIQQEHRASTLNPGINFYLDTQFIVSYPG